MDYRKINKILFIRKDNKIGDMIINTRVFTAIKKEYPNIKIGVLSGQEALEIIKYNEDIDIRHNYKKGFLNLLKMVKEIRKEKYEVVIDFKERESTTSQILLYLLNIKENIGYTKKGVLNRCNHFIQYNYNTFVHITKKYDLLLNFINIPSNNFDYKISLSDFEERKAKYFILETNKEKINTILLNRFGSHKKKELSIEKTIEILDEFTKLGNKYKIYLSYLEKYKNEMHIILEKTKNKNVHLTYETKNIRELSGILKNVDYVISVDTSLIHIASSYKKPVLGIYCDEVMKFIWGPYKTKFQTIVSKNKENINEINIKEIIEKFILLEN